MFLLFPYQAYISCYRVYILTDTEDQEDEGTLICPICDEPPQRTADGREGVRKSADKPCL